MSVVTPRPPAPPRGDEPPDVEALEALIEEARRRARRRRRLYGASALLIAAAGLIAYFGFGGVAAPGPGALPVSPDIVLARHVRLRSQGAWLSRSFFRAGFGPAHMNTAVKKLRKRLEYWFNRGA